MEGRYIYLPNGIATKMMNDGIKWRSSPPEGEPKGQFEAQKRPKGTTPSFASSWFTRACANVTAMTLPRAERATNTLR